MSALRFSRLEIHRMPGIESNGFLLDELSDGINLIYGPNASGKTTTSRAMEALLWPRSSAAAGAWLAARYRIDSDMWSVDLQGSRVEYQRNGLVADPVPLPPLEERDRYFLALHELLRSENAAFARTIMQESAGGYDVVAAGSRLSPRAGASQLRNEVSAREQAELALGQATERQSGIRAAEATLSDLRLRLAAARDALEQVSVLDVALEHAAARDSLHDARILLESFPAAMAHMTGDERDRLRQLSTDLASIEGELGKAEADRQRAVEAKKAAALPDDGVGAELVAGLRSDFEVLRDAEREVTRLEQSQAALAIKLGDETRRVKGGPDGELLRALDHQAMGALADFARSAAEIHAQQSRLEAERAVIGEPTVALDPDQFAEGARLLRRWLREPEPHSEDDRRIVWGRVAAAGLVVIGLLFALLHPAAPAAAIAGAVLLYLLRGVPATEPDPRPIHQRAYERLGLDRPQHWSAKEVEPLLDELLRKHAEALAAQERHRRYLDVQGRLIAHQEKIEELAEQRAVLSTRLGVSPAIDEGHLYWLAERINRWQDVSNELQGEREALASAVDRVNGLAQAIAERLEPFTSGILPTSGALDGAIRELEQRQRASQAAHVEQIRADAAIIRLRKDRDRCVANRRALFRKLFLDEGDEAILMEWCSRFEEFRETRAEVQRRETMLEQCVSRLGALEADPVLHRATREELLRRRDDAAAAAAEADDLNRQVVQIEMQVRAARESHDIEQALERLERCTDVLRDAREKDVRSVVANVLLEHVQQATREEHLPAVFRRAKELFARLTHGRYELVFSSEGDPSFRAYDTTEKRGRSLDQLSSGTRVQLLLAVRVAFVEAQEQGVRLPLVLDEVLGNSDDERAAAIMETAIQLAEDGRQIFYFTAQPDEVGKWRRAMTARREVPWRLIDLAERRQIAGMAELPEDAAALEPRERVPAPGGISHGEYGRVLRIPGIRVGTSVAEVHLWYLLDSPERLHSVLQLGAHRWGALRTLVTAGGARLLPSDLVPTLEPLARAAESFLHESSVGRGMPVDWKVVEDSGAITKTFLNRVVDLARSLNGDARALVDALQSGEIPRFRKDNADALAAYLEEHGYLDRRAPLSDAEVRQRVISTVASEIEAGMISVPAIDSLIARLQAGMRSPAAEPGAISQRRRD